LLIERSRSRRYVETATYAYHIPITAISARRAAVYKACTHAHGAAGECR